MDVTVKPDDDISSLLTDIRLLIKECILPRLDKLEQDVDEIKQFVWPVCAPFYEKGSQLDNIPIKSKILKSVPDEQIQSLLRRKRSICEKHSGDPLGLMVGREVEEYHRILEHLER